jgi:hypothetical protein
VSETLPVIWIAIAAGLMVWDGWVDFDRTETMSSQELAWRLLVALLWPAVALYLLGAVLGNMRKALSRRR